MSLGAFVIVVMALVPPWHQAIDNESFRLDKPAGYAPVFMPPPLPKRSSGADDTRYSSAVDFGRLGLQVVAVVFLVAVTLLLTAGRESNGGGRASRQPAPLALPPPTTEPRRGPERRILAGLIVFTVGAVLIAILAWQAQRQPRVPDREQFANDYLAAHPEASVDEVLNALNQAQATFADEALLVGLLLLWYVHGAVCLQILADRHRVQPTWVAWVPALSWVLEMKLAAWNTAWALLFLIPGWNLVFRAVAWWRIAGRTGHVRVAGLLMALPVVSMIPLTYLTLPAVPARSQEQQSVA